jgi:hypothetical protein
MYNTAINVFTFKCKTITWGGFLQCKDANSPPLQSQVVILPHFPQAVSPTLSPDPFLNCHIFDAILNWQKMTSAHKKSSCLTQYLSNILIDL